MASEVYVIRDWSEHFEVAQSKRAAKLAWVALPNKHDGKSFRRLMRKPGAPSLYGAWVLIVQVASKCPLRGVLADIDGPLSADDIGDKTMCPAKTIQQALDACCEPAIGWIEKREWPLRADSEHTPSTLRADSEHDQPRSTTINRDQPRSTVVVLQDRTGQDITEQDRTKEGDATASGSPPTRVFVPPTVDDVVAYCRERRNKVDPQRFIAFYSSKGWMVGKNKMKDWRAAIHGWERDNGSHGGKPQTVSAGPGQSHPDDNKGW